MNSIQMVVSALAAVVIVGLAAYAKSTATELESTKLALSSAVAQVQLQNSAVEAMKAEADAKLEAGRVALEAAADVARKAKTKAAVIYKTAPSVPGKSCTADKQSALSLINGVAQ